MDLDFDAFEILSAEEERVIAEMNQTAKPYEDHVTIPDLFARQVAITPQQTAIYEYGSSITYAELEEQANRMARLLHAAGVRPNQRVAVVAERGIELLVAIFGVLKAGAAYVPIDPDYPKKRVQYMLRDSACGVLITESAKLQAMLGDLPESMTTVVCLDETKMRADRLKVYQRSDWERQEQGSWACPAGENDLAYLIYTSGSTGDPKGVMMTHKAVLNTLFWLQDTFCLTAEDVIAQKTSASFTDSVWEFFWPLIYGAKLSIFSSDTVKDPQRLYEQLRDDKITITQFVPAQMSLFLDAVPTEETDHPLPELKWVFNGGEALLVNGVRDWYSIFQQAKIANIYGMTESAIYATCYLIDASPAEGELSIPLGRPLANTHVYILDKEGQLCPFEVKGEICIGGIGLTEGYWNKAEATAKAFTQHPKTGEQLYRTGDLGLLRPDGILEYSGRKDDQVQVRGYRVELKEVERAVSVFPGIKETAVIAQTDEFGVTNLLCYFTSLEKGLEVDDLTTHLREILPEYMIPGFFMELLEMPLTPNGKIDRKNLPQPEGRVHRSTAYVAPRNEREHMLTKIWAGILNISPEDVGIHDSFFEIGGNSISIVRLHRKMKHALGSEATVAELFSYPTIAAYMNHFENQSKDDEQLDQDLMSLLDQIEDGSLDVSESIRALDHLKEG
ncbi:non-ribosomal peptide synthetase [Paenibacillus sp. S02]|uniref:non-ribosomal peptide synthetase n=1 Tax=Paenibacillus sp. S02 TaxID=2823904 RepID=UPI001C647F3E|nr:non-ribosomal peptide synthetase [Paenibacillus sp. S02]QYK66039.1 Tyrocidine synthase 3 [Paenibacillus sp. S02]